MTTQPESRQVRRAKRRALLKKLITKKDRRILCRTNDTKLRKAIIEEVFLSADKFAAQRAQEKRGVRTQQIELD